MRCEGCEDNEYLFQKYQCDKWGPPSKYHFDDKQRQELQAKYNFHLGEGLKAYEAAKNRAWWLPDLDDREKARYCFTSSIALLGCASPCGRLLAAISTLFVQYGLDAMDEWHYIQGKLYDSQSHFELCDYYAGLL